MLSQQKAAAALIRLCVAIAVVYALSRWDQWYVDKVDGLQRQELRWQLIAVHVPEGVRCRGDHVDNHVGPVGATRHLRLAHPMDEVARRYYAWLQQDGWALIRPGNEDGRMRSMMFCKDATVSN